MRIDDRRGIVMGSLAKYNVLLKNEIIEKQVNE